MKKSTKRGKTKQKGWRIDGALADRFTAFCLERGWNPNRQVEIALREWLESHAKRRARR
jgi:hypothetical protein